MGRDSSVGVATDYGMGSPGIESRCGRDFRPCPERPCGPPSLLHNGYRIFPVDKSAGAWRSPPTPSSAEVKERVELYLYCPSGPSWSVLGWPLPLRVPSYLLHVSTTHMTIFREVYYKRYIPYFSIDNARFIYIKRSKLVKNKHALYTAVYIILGCALYIRCALSIEKYGI